MAKKSTPQKKAVAKKKPAAQPKAVKKTATAKQTPNKTAKKPAAKKASAAAIRAKESRKAARMKLLKTIQGKVAKAKDYVHAEEHPTLGAALTAVEKVAGAVLGRPKR